jgi:hypothetical protein
MGIELASRATIIISVLTLGYNLYHLSNAYAYMRIQFQGFRQALAEESFDVSKARRFNQFLMVLMPLAYVALLFWAGFAWWLLVAVIAKYAMTGFLSDFFQVRVVQGKCLRRHHFRLLKLDALLNALLLALILYVAVI